MLPNESRCLEHCGLHALAGQQEFVGQRTHHQPQDRSGYPQGRGAVRLACLRVATEMIEEMLE